MSGSPHPRFDPSDGASDDLAADPAADAAFPIGARRRDVSDDARDSLGGRPPAIDSAALERLVQRAIAESQHSGARGAPKSEVVIAAAARLESLLATYGDVDALRQRLTDQREALTAELSRLRSAVVARRGFLEADGDAAVWPVDPERWRTLRWRVQARLAALLDGAGAANGGSSGAARVAAQEILDLFAKERATSLAEQRRLGDAEVVQLERRLQALATTVEQAEQVLEVLREAPIDGTGVASYFRAPEGLDPADQRRSIKLALLDGVFRENVDLRRRAGDQPGD